MNTIDFTPHATLTWLEDFNAIRVEWLQLYMDLERFQEICGAALQLLHTHGGNVWIADQYKSLGVFDKHIQDFIIEDLGPLAEQNGIALITTVMPREAGLSSLSTKRWNRNAEEKGRIPTYQFDTLENCKKWLLEQGKPTNEQA